MDTLNLINQTTDMKNCIDSKESEENFDLSNSNQESDQIEILRPSARNSSYFFPQTDLIRGKNGSTCSIPAAPPPSINLDALSISARSPKESERKRVTSINTSASDSLQNI